MSIPLDSVQAVQHANIFLGALQLAVSRLFWESNSPQIINLNLWQLICSHNVPLCAKSMPVSPYCKIYRLLKQWSVTAPIELLWFPRETPTRGPFNAQISATIEVNGYYLGKHYSMDHRRNRPLWLWPSMFLQQTSRHLRKIGLHN